ncbi:hypothetical protein J2S74_003259 [Evansella vedderi]|uniref:DUF3231 family protein n=1 Tax=Evansella vedderi TaxID=38282 RepID=A0ABT9ZY38_9BACI|nr:DUF3231 family protein [Evansella vedderi]MDQ0255875.1 hypothetical protein [Evansella vedderi]
MEKNVKLSSTEIAALWTVYMQDSAFRCFLKHFLNTVQDEEIKPILQLSLDETESHLEKISNIFKEENFPIPSGFSDDDIDLTAPSLFNDSFALSFVYSNAAIGLMGYGKLTATIARKDVLEFFSNCLMGVNNLYKKSVNLMLSKGIYDRPPTIPYPNKVDFIDDKSFLTGWLGKRRPINVIELTELFFNIERNFFGVVVLTGFSQVVEDKEIREYFIKGKDFAEKQAAILNEILKEEDLLGTTPVGMEVTDSTTAPFSDKLMLYMVTSLNSTAIGFMGFGLGTSMRRDLGAHYARIMMEIMKFSEDGANLMINRNWLEQPPQAPNRDSLVNH